MAETKALETKSYRVVGVGANYQKATQTLGHDGETRVVLTRTLALRGETIELVPFEADRLLALGAVRPVSDELSYDEMSDEQLESETTRRNLDVRGSAADGSVRREDRINALTIHDQGVGVGGVAPAGATTMPGGVAVTRPGSSEAQPIGASPVDAESSSVAELGSWIEENKPNADDTVALAQDDPRKAEKVLAAERTATSGSPRATVAQRLQKIIDGQ